MSAEQKVAVIGHPIGHTMSPFIHKRLFELSGKTARYSVLDIPDLRADEQKLRSLDCFNVTIPHKSGIIPLLDGLDKKAEAFGSVNTVKVENGKMFGYTTDGAGCKKALEKNGLSLSGKVLILGNGGAARALAFELAESCPGFQLTLACREQSLDKALALARELSDFAKSLGDTNFLVKLYTYAELEQEVDTEYDLLLNATSVGMYLKTGESPVTEKVISRCKAVFDAVYNPKTTELLRLAESCGVKTVGGMEMLVYQAVAAHEIWYGTKFDPAEIKKLCRDAEDELLRLFGGNDNE